MSQLGIMHPEFQKVRHGFTTVEYIQKLTGATFRELFREASAEIGRSLPGGNLSQSPALHPHAKFLKSKRMKNNSPRRIQREPTASFCLEHEGLLIALRPYRLCPGVTEARAFM
jgi:hypothetical protein